MCEVQGGQLQGWSPELLRILFEDGDFPRWELLRRHSKNA